MLEEEELKSAILVVLANKQDIEGAMSVTEVGTIFALLMYCKMIHEFRYLDFGFNLDCNINLNLDFEFTFT